MEINFQEHIYTNSNFPKSNTLFKKVAIYLLVFFVFFILVCYFTFSSPRNFPNGIIVSVENGDSLRAISLKLKNEHIVRSRIAFETFILVYGGDRRVISADYLFESGVPVWQVARRISKGERHLAPVKVTIPEGFTSEEIANTFDTKLSSFDKNIFLESAKNKEGYLFPDTYFFFTDATTNDVLKSLTDNFNKKILTLDGDIKQSGKSQTDIIKMASLIELEAEGSLDRDMIAGILWHRIAINMPLQADAAPETYKNKGLPKSPVSNPGLSAIKAAIYPKSSPYLYYLHDKEGGVHYARTFAEHRSNINKYLK